MGKAKIKIDWPVVHDLAHDVIVSETARVAAAAGEGFGHDVRKGKKRWRGQVKTETYAAMRRNARENTLLRAIGGGV